MTRTHPCSNLGPVGLASRGCARYCVRVAASSCAGSSLLWQKPSGIFNWKLILSPPNRRPRQETRHPPTRPAHLGRDAAQAWLRFNGAAASITLKEHILIF